MPGIVGLISKMPPSEAERQLKLMLATIRHEPFYVMGTWIDEAMGVYVGWVEREDSFCADKPLRSESGDHVLIFSGEEFPAPGLKRDLKSKGHAFEDSGSEYLVHWAEDDRNFPAGLNGRFHGLLADHGTGTATLFNDRYGMHRLYYHAAKDALYFACEAKAILAVHPELRTLDRRALGEWISCGCVLESRTLFEGIEVLPPASAWAFQNGCLVRQDSYFRPQEWEDQAPLDEESFYQELRQVFSHNLSRYFESGGRVGMSLTGGLDCRMILSWLKPQPGSLPCYTFGDGVGLRQCRDVVVAQRVARACGQAHEIIPVGMEFLSRFDHYANRTIYLSDGCVNLTYSPDLYLNQRARQIAPVRMTGNYGSEVLRRSVAFGPDEPAPGLFITELMESVRDARGTYDRISQGHPLSFAVFCQAPWHQHGLLALEQTQLSLRSPYLDNDLVRTTFRAPDSALRGNDLCLRLIEDGDANLRRIPTDRGINGKSGHITSSLARAILEFTFRAEYHYDIGMPQWLARVDHLLSPLHLEKLFLGWHKFHHFRIWYRNELSQYVRDILLDGRTLSRPYLVKNRVQEIVSDHIAGTHNYTSEIHTLLGLELLHRNFIDQ